MRVLFVCTANVSRSRVAEEIFGRLTRELPETERGRYEARSAGVRADPSGRQLGEADLDWADVVCVMEAAHRTYIARHFRRPLESVRVLGIPDVYAPGDPVLADLLTSHIRLLLAERARRDTRA
jgi:predicted protein tyrosine phosphatase